MWLDDFAVVGGLAGFYIIMYVLSLGSVWDHVGAILGSLWDQFGITLGSL